MCSYGDHAAWQYKPAMRSYGDHAAWQYKPAMRSYDDHAKIRVDYFSTIFIAVNIFGPAAFIQTHHN